MPVPQSVSPSNFTLRYVLYDDGDFAIAWGLWHQQSECIGMRWNGSIDDPGYPKLFRHPIWFVVPEALAVPILKALIGLPGTNKTEIMQVLSQLLP